MAQKKDKGKGGRGKFDQAPEDAEAKVLKDARQDAELRLRKIVERRNALNDEARQAREARDSFNAERRRLHTEGLALIAERDALQGRIRAAKGRRGEAQGRAKQLIALKQEKRKGAPGGAGQRVRELEAAVKALEFKQQTTVLTGPKEQELLDDIKEKMAELASLRKLKEQQDAVFGEIKDLDAAITDAFAKADEAHAEVVGLSQQWQALTDKLQPTFQELGHLKSEADKRHQQFVELRQRADAEHQKTLEMRQEVDAKHAEVQKLYDERRAVVQELRQQVRRLDDPQARDAVAEDAVRLLREKGRISL